MVRGRVPLNYTFGSIYQEANTEPPKKSALGGRQIIAGEYFLYEINSHNRNVVRAVQRSFNKHHLYLLRIPFILIAV